MPLFLRILASDPSLAAFSGFLFAARSSLRPGLRTRTAAFRGCFTGLRWRPGTAAIRS